jgi:transcriptional regulator with XRE-family HTH domain
MQFVVRWMTYHPRASLPTLRAYQKTIGANIRRLRKARDWSQERLADVSHVGQSYIGRLERGTVNVSIGTLCELGKALEVEIPEFLKVTD